jgi:hypothetical protein
MEKEVVSHCRATSELVFAVLLFTVRIGDPGRIELRTLIQLKFRYDSGD